MLGADVLSFFSIGFDWERSEVTFWRGPVEEKAALDWVTSASGGAKAVSLRDLKRNDLYLEIPCTIGGWSGPLILDSGASTMSLLPELIGKTKAVGIREVASVQGRHTVIEKFMLAQSIECGGAEIPWPTLESSELTRDLKSVAGVISLRTFRSSRILVDLRSASVYFAPAIQDKSIADAFNAIGAVPIQIQGDSLRIAPNRSMKLKEFAGAEIVAIAGIKTQTLLEALRGKGKSPLTVLTNCAKKQNRAFEVVLRKESREVKIIVPGLMEFSDLKNEW
jgi:hypothetical protein